MKNKSKLPIFAVVVLQALLLLMPVSVLARDESTQEIGVPQPSEAQVTGCSVADLSPDGDRVYSVSEGVLSRYEINPFKRTGLTAIDWGKLKDKANEKSCRVGITADKSKFILVNHDKIFLLDARTGQILNRVERKGGFLGSAMLNDNDLLTIDVVGLGAGQDTPPFYSLKIWEADTLTLRREILDLGKSFNLFWDQNSRLLLAKSPGRIYMKTDQSIVVLDSKNYAPELSLFRPGLYEAADTPKISSSFQKISFRGVSKVTDYLTGKTASYADVSRERVLIFDQETRKFHQEKMEFKRESMERISDEEYFSFFGFNLQFSRNNESLMSLVSPSTRASLINLKTGLAVDFKQYENGEAILTERPISGGPKYFQLTPGARKYLMMKNSSGEVVPINDATFAKYKRAEGSH